VLEPYDVTLVQLAQGKQEKTPFDLKWMGLWSFMQIKSS